LPMHAKKPEANANAIHLGKMKRKSLDVKGPLIFRAKGPFAGQVASS